MQDASRPVYASFPSEKLTIGAGVAIFHIATARVVVCWHSKHKYWFLPKGRKNANEDVRAAAEREGFEESGYRNRLLPLPFKHRQTDSDEGHQRFVTEPIWTQLLPLTSTAQYLLFWFIAETLPSAEEAKYTEPAGSVYRAPAAFPLDVTLQQRIDQDRGPAMSSQETYQPVKHEGTGVNEDESYYVSHLLSVDEAMQKLRGGVTADVIRRGWAGIQRRIALEAEGLSNR